MRPDCTDSDRLMDRASSGDDEAFGPLASAWQDELFRLARAHGLGHADAAEAVQETFLRAYRIRRRWRRGARVWAWLAGIAMNVAREFRRKRARVVRAVRHGAIRGGQVDDRDSQRVHRSGGRGRAMDVGRPNVGRTAHQLSFLVAERSER